MKYKVLTDCCASAIEKKMNEASDDGWLYVSESLTVIDAIGDILFTVLMSKV